jgi:hypothetical protein
VKRSAQPLLDGARALLAEGTDPAARLTMRHAGSAYDALRSTVGIAAKLTVTDATNGSPRLGQWNSYRPAVSIGSPMRQNEVAVTEVAPLAEAA